MLCLLSPVNLWLSIVLVQEFAGEEAKLQHLSRSLEPRRAGGNTTEPELQRAAKRATTHADIAAVSCPFRRAMLAHLLRDVCMVMRLCKR